MLYSIYIIYATFIYISAIFIIQVMLAAGDSFHEKRLEKIAASRYCCKSGYACRHKGTWARRVRNQYGSHEAKGYCLTPFVMQLQIYYTLHDTL